MNSLDVFLKTPWFSSPCEWFRFACQRNLKSFKMTSWPRLPPKVHLRRKVKYWTCHFLSALHFPEIEGSRFETCRLCKFVSNPWVPIEKNNENQGTLIKNRWKPAYESMKIKGNHWFPWFSKYYSRERSSMAHPVILLHCSFTCVSYNAKKIRCYLQFMWSTIIRKKVSPRSSQLCSV